MKNLNHARVRGHEEIACAFDHDGIRTPNPPPIEFCIRLCTADASFHERRGEHEFADVRLGVRHVSVSKSFGHQQCNAEHELTLSEILSCALVGRVRREVSCNTRLVEELYISKKKYALPRHEHVVEEDDAIHLVEPRAQRIVKARTPLIEIVATKEPKSFRAARNRKVEGERIMSIRMKWNTRRVHCDLVGEGPERGEDTRASDNDSRVGFANAVQSGSLLKVVETAGIAAALQVDKGMRENQVFLADVLVVTAHIVCELRATAGEILR